MDTVRSPNDSSRQDNTMSGVYIHSTSAIRAILKSGSFLGTTKEMQKTGASAEELGIPDEKLHTLFVQWRVGNVAESVSRITASKGDLRGVMVFTDPDGNMAEAGGYPALIGAKVSLAKLSLRGLLVSEEDMKAQGQTWEALRVLVRPYAAQIFAFDAEAIDTIKDGRYINQYLLSAANSGALF
jgi:hypothetical protein